MRPLQQWLSRGVLFQAAPERPWSRTHAQMPTVAMLDDERLLVLFATRDANNQSRIGSLVFSLPDFKLCRTNEEPALELGPLGAFDDAGVMPSSLVQNEGMLYLYYVGWNRRVDVPYHNAVGLAVSHDEGRSFQRVFSGPVLDRTEAEPYFCGTTCVRQLDDQWFCWYMSCNGWSIVDGVAEANYDIKLATSIDGRYWLRSQETALPQISSSEAIARVSVVSTYDAYHLWFCSRSTSGYRQKDAQAYQIGHAHSYDLRRWTRSTSQTSIVDASGNQDAPTRSYPEVFAWRDRLFMLYNTSDFGRGGCALAELRS